MVSQIRNLRALGAIVVLFITILVLDLYALPGHLLVSSLYAIPILIAAHSLRPRMVGVVALASLFFDLLSVWLKSPPDTIWPYGLLAIMIVGYLGVLASRESEEASRRTEQASRRAAEAEEARQRLQEFTGMIAHDLRGPLTVMLGFIQILGKGREAVAPEVSDKAIRAAESQARRMDRLIGDLLDASHIGTGRFTIERQRVDLVKVARRVVEEQQATTARHRIVLRAPASLEGWWDAGRIVQVLTNLLTNAIKYSPQGGEVQVNLARVNDSVVVKVTDRGIGLAPEDIPLLFEPFSRLYREQPVKGTGLGLYISKAIVEAHGGRIWAESPGRGKGSIFVFTLPLSRNPEQG
ncbi:MAG: HAMP domain-containing histidine kinase [Chloroflexi bacterium]|nr:HAMP domain-containing histidine kinase [Chloroflexota bacterium]